MPHQETLITPFMKKVNTNIDSEVERRQFIKWVSMSSLALGLPLPFVSCDLENNPKSEETIDLSSLKNVFDFEKLSIHETSQSTRLFFACSRIRPANHSLRVWHLHGLLCRRMPLFQRRCSGPRRSSGSPPCIAPGARRLRSGCRG